MNEVQLFYLQYNLKYNTFSILKEWYTLNYILHKFYFKFIWIITQLQRQLMFNNHKFSLLVDCFCCTLPLPCCCTLPLQCCCTLPLPCSISEELNSPYVLVHHFLEGTIHYTIYRLAFTYISTMQLVYRIHYDECAEPMCATTSVPRWMCHDECAKPMCATTSVPRRGCHDECAMTSMPRHMGL